MLPGMNTSLLAIWSNSGASRSLSTRSQIAAIRLAINATDVLSVKIANSIVDWRPELCVGEFKLPGCTISKGLDVLTPAEAHTRGAQTLVIAPNNSGGYIEQEWIPAILDALDQGLDIASGLHERLTDIPEVVEKARSLGRQLIDVRHVSGKLQTGKGHKRSGKRLLTVGTDCSVGKMYTSLAIDKGIAIDCVISDFISGAAEQLTPDNDPQHWDIVEGQGSLSHASFAGVSLGLLHGTQPDALVLCHAENRAHMRGMPDYPLPGLQEAMDMNLEAAKLTSPEAKFIGIAVNTSMLSDEDSRAILSAYEAETGLPSVDPVRTGVASIVDNLQERRRDSNQQ